MISLDGEERTKYRVSAGSDTISVRGGSNQRDFGPFPLLWSLTCHGRREHDDLRLKANTEIVTGNAGTAPRDAVTRGLGRGDAPAIL